MIYYVDASALVKVYARERGSERMIEIMNGPDDLITSKVAYCEVLCTLARKHRNQEFSNDDFTNLISEFKEDWQTLYVIEVTDELLESIEKLLRLYALKALDVIHLGSAKGVKDSIEPAEGLVFLCSNGSLKNAAGSVGMRVSDPEEGFEGHPAR